MGQIAHLPNVLLAGHSGDRVTISHLSFSHGIAVW